MGMNHVSTADLLEHLNWRYATKAFDATKKIPPADWEALEEALVLTPTSYGLQPWKGLVVTDMALREQLKPLTWNQSQVTDCSQYVIFTIRKNLPAEHVDHFVARTAAVRSQPVEALEGYRKMMLSDVVYGPRSLDVNTWAAKQAYIALGNFMTCAALLGVDTCPIEGFEPAQYDKVLGLAEKGLASVVCCAAGYRAADDKYAELPKVRFPKAEMLEWL